MEMRVYKTRFEYWALFKLYWQHFTQMCLSLFK